MDPESWSLLAEPVKDGSDLVMLAREAGLRHKPLARGFSLSERAARLDFEPKNKPFLTPDDRGIPPEADALLQAWPLGLEMARVLLVALYPCRDPRWTPTTLGGCYGCKSESVADFGHVYSSTMNVVGFVEGLVASLANWKLYASGIAHGRWARAWLDLPDDAVYPMPLRPSEAVPAGNVIHHAYCCAHILAFHQELLRTLQPRGAAWGARQAYTRVSHARATIVQDLIKAGGDGVPFLVGLVGWMDNLLDVPPPAVGD